MGIYIIFIKKGRKLNMNFNIAPKKIMVCLLVTVIVLLLNACSKSEVAIRYVKGETSGVIESNYSPFKKVDLTDEQVEHVIQLINQISFSKPVNSDLPDGDVPELFVWTKDSEYRLVAYSDYLVYFQGTVYDVTDSSEIVSKIRELYNDILE